MERLTTKYRRLAGLSIPVRVPQRFRRFDTMADSFADHARLLLTRPMYGAALAYPTDPVGFARAIAPVYATDPAYGDKLVAVLRDRALPSTFGLAPL